jgi:hypothetical protein
MISQFESSSNEVEKFKRGVAEGNMPYVVAMNFPSRLSRAFRFSYSKLPRMNPSADEALTVLRKGKPLTAQSFNTMHERSGNTSCMRSGAALTVSYGTKRFAAMLFVRLFFRDFYSRSLTCLQ